MSTALIKHEEHGLAEIMQLGDVFKASGYFRDVRDQAQAVVKILYGRELGFSPVVSMMGIHVIEGKPALSANLMGAMVKRSGKYNYMVLNLTDTVCLLEFTEHGKKIGNSTFTIEDAQRAGVCRPGSGWTKYPRNMLFARALSNGVKLFCPELSACPIYVPEELGAEVNEEGSVIEPHIVENRSEKRAEKPITFKRESAPNSAGTTVEQVVLQGAEQRNGADTNSTAAVSSPVSQVRVESAPESESQSAVEYISIKQQKEFHAACRAAAGPPDSPARKKADQHTYQWLVDNQYLTPEGNPSASAIPASSWPKARDMAAKWVGAQ